MKKNKWRWAYALWAKLLLAVLGSVCMLVLVVGSIGTILYSQLPSYEAELQNKYENAAMNYSAYALQLLADGKDADKVQEILNNTSPNFQFGIVSSYESELSQVDLSQKTSWLIGSPADAEQYEWTYGGSDGLQYYYRIDDVLSGGIANMGSYYVGTCEVEDSYTTALIDGIIFDPETGIYYLQSDDNYYPVNQVDLTLQVPMTLNLVNSILEDQYGVKAGLSDTEEAANLEKHPEEVLPGLEVLNTNSKNLLLSAFGELDSTDSGDLYITLDLHGEIVTSLEDGYVYTAIDSNLADDLQAAGMDLKSLANTDWTSVWLLDADGFSNYQYDRTASTVLSEKAIPADAQIVTDQTFFWNDEGNYNVIYLKKNATDCLYYWVLSWIPDPVDYAADDLFAQWTQILPVIYKAGKWCLPAQILSLLLLLVLLAVYVPAVGHRPEDDELHLRFWDKIPYLLWLVFVVTAESILVAIFIIVLKNTAQYEFRTNLLFTLEPAMAGLLLGVEFLSTTIVRIKAKVFWKYTIFSHISAPFKQLYAMAQAHVPLFVRLVLLIGGVSLFELLVILNSIATGGGVGFFFLVLLKIAEVMVLLAACMQMVRLYEGSRKMAEGNLDTPIDTAKLNGKFKEHGENLNHISDAIEAAVQKEMKSEHFQTELITNVSHDIKTPLTSIINYVDLLKTYLAGKAENADPQLQEYVDVLTRQSAKLKKLIEDLTDASKASTGNLTVHLEETDAAILLEQAVGEFEERLEKNHLQAIVSSPEPPVTIIADGRHLWRVFDNLLGNICKYALPGSRVYMNLAQDPEKTTIIFRNISAAPLNISSEELMARFVRGDVSRNTEGSGLGLNIAQSLMTLMNGKLTLDVDGDLFKVTLTFPA